MPSRERYELYEPHELPDHLRRYLGEYSDPPEPHSPARPVPGGEEPQVTPQRPHGEEETPPPDHRQGGRDPDDPGAPVPLHPDETAADFYNPENHSPFAWHPDRALLEDAVARFPEVFDRPRTLEELHQAIGRGMSFEEVHQALRPDLSPEEFERLASSAMTFGEAHQTLRPDMSFDEFNAAARPDMSFDELMAVRDFSFQHNGEEAPPLSRENLELFLDRVWSMDNIHSSDDVYSLYRSASDLNRPTSSQGYVREMGDILRHRTGDGQRAFIHGGREYIFLTPENAGNVPPWEASFLRFNRAGTDPDNVNYRVFVNPEADAAPALMDGIVREIVDRPDDFPGIHGAKVAGPYRLSADGLVIYVNDLPEAYRVVDWLKNYQGQHPDAFRWDVPALSNQVMEGVAIGASTPEGASSFGDARSNAIFDALQSTRAANGDFAAFREAVLARLREAGVDPDLPHENYTR